MAWETISNSRRRSITPQIRVGENQRTISVSGIAGVLPTDGRYEVLIDSSKPELLAVRRTTEDDQKGVQTRNPSRNSFQLFVGTPERFHGKVAPAKLKGDMLIADFSKNGHA